MALGGPVVSRIIILYAVTLLSMTAVTPSQAQSVAARMEPASVDSAGVTGDPGLRSAEHLVAAFDGSDTLHMEAAHSVGFGYFTGNTRGVAAAPRGDTSQYVAVGAGGSVAFDLRGYTNSTSELSSVSAYVGSLDSYNFVQLLGINADGSINFDDPLLSLSGDQLIDLNRGARDGRLTFGFDGTTRIGGILFGSTGISFEFDSLAVSQSRVTTPSLISKVPEPASWAMFLAGFGLAGSSIRRQKKALKFA